MRAHLRHEVALTIPRPRKEGRDPAQGWIYLLRWPWVCKVGRGVWEDRLAAHVKRVGAEPEVLHKEWVTEAVQLERYVLEQARARGLRPVRGLEWFAPEAAPVLLGLLDPGDLDTQAQVC